MSTGLQNEITKQFGVPGGTETKVHIKFYTHSDKDSNWETYEELCTEFGFEYDEDIGRTFSYCGYEVDFDCLFDFNTGKCFATRVNGVELTKEIELT